MSLLIFPGICLYFLIGWMFADVSKTDLGESSIKSILLFLFWPITFLIIAVFYVFFLVLSLISIAILAIDRVYRYFRHRRTNDNAS